MQSVNDTAQIIVTDSNDSISFIDIVDFIQAWWKAIVVAALVGGCLGFGGWALLAKYKAESIMINEGALTFMSWRGLQKNLPILAAQMISNKQVKKEEEDQFLNLANAKWWEKNIVPTYSLTKNDTKDLVTISKELQESGGTNILNLVVTTTGSNKKNAATNAEITTKFIKQGAAYLQVKSLINGYEANILNTDAELQKKITDAEVDLKFMRERAKNLEALRQRFPANVAVNSGQVIDLKDSNAKFMPISTQLVAVNTDINSTVESLQLMQHKLAQTATLREFVIQATPIVSRDTNGIAVIDALLEVESSLRQQLKPNDTNGLQSLNNIKATLIGMRTGFTKNFYTDLVPYVSKPNALPATAGGLFGAAVLTILYALTRKTFNSLKASRL